MFWKCYLQLCFLLCIVLPALWLHMEGAAVTQGSCYTEIEGTVLK